MTNAEAQKESARRSIRSNIASHETALMNYQRQRQKLMKELEALEELLSNRRKADSWLTRAFSDRQKKVLNLQSIIMRNNTAKTYQRGMSEMLNGHEAQVKRSGVQDTLHRIKREIEKKENDINRTDGEIRSINLSIDRLWRDYYRI